MLNSAGQHCVRDNMRDNMRGNIVDIIVDIMLRIPELILRRNSSAGEPSTIVGWV
jgi:hypothetical protein